MKSTIKVMIQLPVSCVLTESKNNFKITFPKEISQLLDTKKKYQALFFHNDLLIRAEGDPIFPSLCGGK